MGKDISKSNPPILLTILKVLFATMRKKGKEEERNKDRGTEEERKKGRKGNKGRCRGVAGGREIESRTRMKKNGSGA